MLKMLIHSSGVNHSNLIHLLTLALAMIKSMIALEESKKGKEKKKERKACKMSSPFGFHVSRANY